MGNRLSFPYQGNSAEDLTDILLNYESLLVSLSYFFDMDVIQMCKCKEQASILKCLFNQDTIAKTHVPVGTEILTKGEALRGLYIIDTGVVKIVKNSSDTPIQLDSGNHFGMDQPFQVQLGNVCDITAKTVTDCCLWFIERSTLLRLEKTFKDMLEDIQMSDDLDSSLDNSVKGCVEVINSKKGKVRFNPTVKVVLMATKEEYEAWGLKNDLWYQQCDYDKFRKEHKDFLQRQSIYKCDQATNMLVDAYDFEEDSKV